MIDDLVAAEPGFAAVSLRYFNPVGAHASGLIGEHPRGVPNNLFPLIAQTAAGLRDRVRSMATTIRRRTGRGCATTSMWSTSPAGTWRRSTSCWRATGRGRNLAVNLGCGRGYSVLESVAAFARAAGRDIPCEVVGRRPGDVAELVADPRRAAELFGWRAERGLGEMCADHWAFQSRLLRCG